jgi:hypothetical protein
MTIEIELDDEVYGNLDKEERLWMNTQILVGDGNLSLHSNELGDLIGVVKKVTGLTWIKEKEKK